MLADRILKNHRALSFDQGPAIPSSGLATAVGKKIMSRLSGKVVVVVGAGSIAPGWSNGKACAVQYAREGAAVVCADFVQDRADEVAELILSEGGRAVAVKADATCEADVQSVVDRAVTEFGRLDVMHNNVGVGGSWGAPDTIAPESWAREINQTLTTAYLGTRCAVPVMRQHGGGAIINISSSFAHRFPRRATVGYSTAKAAVEGMTRACAAAYGGHNIRVNCIRIGFVETPIVMTGLEKLSEAEKEQALNKTRLKVPLRREHGSAFDVAAAAVFLASDDAKYISGEIMNVDGALDCTPL